MYLSRGQLRAAPTPLAPVLDQGYCGSCFIVSALTAVNIHMSLAAQRALGDEYADEAALAPLRKAVTDAGGSGGVVLDYDDFLNCYKYVFENAEEGYTVNERDSISFVLRPTSSSYKFGYKMPLAWGYPKMAVLDVIATELSAQADLSISANSDLRRLVAMGLDVDSGNGGEGSIKMKQVTLDRLSALVGSPVTPQRILAIVKDAKVALRYSPIQREATSSGGASLEDGVCSSADAEVTDAQMYGEGIEDVLYTEGPKQFFDALISDAEIDDIPVCGGGWSKEVMKRIWASDDPSLSRPALRVRPTPGADAETVATSFPDVVYTPTLWESSKTPLLDGQCRVDGEDLSPFFRFYRLGADEFATSAQPLESIATISRGRPVNYDDPEEVAIFRYEMGAVMRMVDAGPVLASIHACDEYDLDPVDAVSHTNPFPRTKAEECACSYVTTTNHAITIVGYYYDDENMRNSYWVIQNSYGKNWGAAGFFFLRWGHMGLRRFAAPLIRLSTETVNPWLPAPRADAIGLPIFDNYVEIGQDAERLNAFLEVGDVMPTWPEVSEHFGFRALNVTTVTPAGVTLGPPYGCSPRLCQDSLPPLTFTALIVELAAPRTATASLDFSATVKRPDLSASSIGILAVRDDAGKVYGRDGEAGPTFVAAGDTWRPAVSPIDGSAYDSVEIRLDLAPLGLTSLSGPDWNFLVLAAGPDSPDLNVVRIYAEYDPTTLDASGYYRETVGGESESASWVLPVAITGGVVACCCFVLLAAGILLLLARRRRRPAAGAVAPSRPAGQAYPNAYM
jgi:hypothetical protein